MEIAKAFNQFRGRNRYRHYSIWTEPRLNGEVVETGASARQVVEGHPLSRDLVAKSSGNVRNRVIDRMLKIAMIGCLSSKLNKRSVGAAHVGNHLTSVEIE